MSGMTREEHIKWCKERAMQEYAYYKGNEGIKNAIVSMMSDLRKHPETNNETLMSLCGMMLVTGQIQTEHQLRQFIDGFN